MTEYTKPIPVPDEATKPFWDAAHDHQLAFQQCQHCGTYAHPPVAFCLKCHNLNKPSFEFAPVSGKGKIVNWTVMQDPMVQGFAADVPWVHILVELDEQPGLWITSTLVDGLSGRLELGAPVEVVFEDITDTISLPKFKLA